MLKQFGKNGSLSSNSGVTLRVDLDRDAYYPGAMLRGQVVMIISKPSVSCIAVRLRIAGKEWMIVRMKKEAHEILEDQRMCFWSHLVTLEGHSKTSVNALRRDNKEMEISLKASSHNSILGSFEGVPAGKLIKGTYTYPFEFMLPLALPSSFVHAGDEEDFASVLYYVKAYADLPAGRSADVICRQHFTVVNRIGMPQLKAQKPSSKSSTHELKFLCCGQGVVNTKIEVKTPLVVLDHDPLIKIRIAVDNSKGKYAVDGIDIALVHLLEVSANGHGEVRRSVVAQDRLEQSVPPTATAILTCDLPVPVEVVPTIQGLLYKSTYYLSVSQDIAVADDPEDVIPITIVQSLEKNERLPTMTFDKAPFGAAHFNEWSYSCPTDQSKNWQPASMELQSLVQSKKSLLMVLGPEHVDEYEGALRTYRVSQERANQASKSVPDPNVWKAPTGLGKYS